MSTGRRERLAAYRAAQQRFRPDRRQFERLVEEALDAVPEEFRRHLENVAVVVEEWPPEREGGRDGEDGPLLGLYEGTPLGERGTGYHLVAPDRITLYRGPILALCRSRSDVIREVRDTVVHEIGHYFGLDDDELP